MAHAKIYLLICILTMTIATASIITSDQKTMFWTINATGVEAVLNVTIPIDDNEHIQICVEKPTAKQLAIIKTAYSNKELKEIPVELISDLTENTDIFITKKSLDFSTTDTQYCMTVWWTKPPKNTSIKIGKQSIIISTYTKNPTTRQNLVRQQDGTLNYCYADSSSDPGIAYSTDNGTTWNDGYDYTTTATYTVCSIYDNGKVLVAYAFDTTSDYQMYEVVNRTTAQLTNQLLISEPSSDLKYADCLLRRDNTYQCAGYANNADIHTRYSGGSDTEIHLYGLYLKLTHTKNSCLFMNFYNTLTTSGKIAKLCNETLGTEYDAPFTYPQHSSMLSLDNDSMLIMGGNTSTNILYLYQSNNEGQTFTQKYSFGNMPITGINVMLGKTIDDTLVAIIELANQSIYGYFSEDLGSTWENLNITFTADQVDLQGNANSYPEYDLVQNPINLAILNGSGAANTYFVTVDIPTSPSTSSCTCPGSGNAWTWDFTDNCDITSDCTGITDITCTAGTSANYIAIKANVEADTYTCDTDAQVHVYPTGKWEIDG